MRRSTVPRAAITPPRARSPRRPRARSTGPTDGSFRGSRRGEERLQLARRQRAVLLRRDHAAGRDRVGLRLSTRREVERGLVLWIERDRPADVLVLDVGAHVAGGVVTHDSDHGEVRVVLVCGVELLEGRCLLLARYAPGVPEVD